jgi:hemoglobin/transferrin/lactoferrin receptor protein
MLMRSCLVGMGVLLYVHAFSQTDTITGGLSEVVVSVNKWEQKQNEIPNTIARINMRDARIYNPQTAADLLMVTGQVFVQKSQLGGGSPMIRGFSTNRVMIVVDGVRMNNAIYRSGNLQNIISIDALSLQNAEVIFGPGSIIYGSDAIGGVMDFHTLQPLFSASKKPLVKLNGFTRYSTANNEKTGHVDFNIGSRKLSLLGSVSYSDFDDLEMGKHGGYNSYLRPLYVQRINNVDSVLVNEDPRVQKQSGYHQWNGLAKLRYKPTQHLDVTYAYHYSSTSNVPRYDRLIEFTNQTPSYAEWYYGPQVWMMNQLQVQYAKANKLFSNGRFIVSMQDYQESRNDRRYRNARLRNQTEAVDIISANLDFNKTIGDKHELFYGAEYISNTVGSTAFRTNINNGLVEPTSTRYPNNSTWKSAGVYASYKYNINDHFTFTSGVRYNHVALSAPFDTSFFKFPFTKAELKDGAFTGSAGLVYRPNTNWQVNTNISSGFRVPNIDDVGRVFDSEAGNVVVPNPSLQAEYAYNIDLGIAHHVQDKLRFDATVFYTILDNAIVRRPFSFNGQDSIFYEGVRSRVQALQNVAEANAWGLQAGLEYFFTKQFSWLLRANYIDGQETDDTQNKKVKLRHAPPFYGNTSVKYNTTKVGVELYVLYNGEISAKNLAPSEQAKPFIYAKDENGKPYSPSWYTLNIKGNVKLNKQVQLGAGLENIINRQYRPYSSGIVAPGMNFIVSLRAGL